MKKVKVSLKINDYVLETNGLIKDNILSFVDKDELKTNIIYDYNYNILTRENNEIKIILYFDKENNNMEYLLKKDNVKFFNNFIKKQLHSDNKAVIINYRMEEENFFLEISYREE